MKRYGLPFAVALFAYPPLADAYIDPHVGLLAIQGIVAAFGAALISMRRVRDALRRLADRILGRKTREDHDGDA